MPLLKPSVFASLLATAALHFVSTSDAVDCSGKIPSIGVAVNSTCYPDGRVDWEGRVNVGTDWIYLEYNCTGSSNASGVAFGPARNNGNEMGTLDVPDWDYETSECYFHGCFQQEALGFPIYSITSVACKVVVPSSALPRPTSTQPLPVSTSPAMTSYASSPTTATATPTSYTTDIPGPESDYVVVPSSALPRPTSTQPLPVPTSPAMTSYASLPTTATATPTSYTTDIPGPESDYGKFLSHNF